MRPEGLIIGDLFEWMGEALLIRDAETRRGVLWKPGTERKFGNSALDAHEGQHEEWVRKLLIAQEDRYPALASAATPQASLGMCQVPLFGSVLPTGKVPSREGPLRSCENWNTR